MRKMSIEENHRLTQERIEEMDRLRDATDPHDQLMKRNNVFIGIDPASPDDPDHSVMVLVDRAKKEITQVFGLPERMITGKVK